MQLDLWQLLRLILAGEHLPPLEAIADRSVDLQALLGSEAHAEAGQVSVGEGEQDHEEYVPGVVRKPHREVGARMDVAQHEERDEDHSHATQDRKPDTVLTRLDTQRETHSQYGTRQQAAVYNLQHSTG